VLTGLGDAMRDKRESAKLVLDLMPYEALSVFYRTGDLAARIVDLVPEEMTREGWDIRIPGDEDTSEKLGAQLDDLCASERFLEASKLKRLYGGGAVLIGVNDGTADLSRPVNEKAIRSVDFLTVFDALECQATHFYENPATKTFGLPEFYRIIPHGSTSLPTLDRVHASRIIRMSGPMSSRRQMRHSNGAGGIGWGDSILLRCAKLLRDYDGSWAGISALMQDFAQTIYKIQGLAQALLADKDSAIKKRMQIIEMSRSLIKAVLLDKDGEDFERKSTVLSGVPEVMDKFAIRIAATAQMPAALLFGQAPAGLNATGASDIRFFYDGVRAQQKRDLLPGLNTLVKFLMLAKDGPCGGKEPDEWAVAFRSLWQLTDGEKAEIRLKMAQADQIYLNMGVFSARDIAEHRFGGDEYSLETHIDPDEAEERSAEAAEALITPTEPATEGS